MPTSAIPRVLIVDDYPDAVDVWAIYLRSAGFEVESAADGYEAIARAVETTPSIVVMDLDLPGCSGIDVARALDSSEVTRRIPRIAATGCSDRRQLDEAKPLFQLIVTKPCDPSELVVQIRRLLAAAGQGATHPE
jgi:two-component system cell cycle response regulator DivK